MRLYGKRWDVEYLIKSGEIASGVFRNRISVPQLRCDGGHTTTVLKRYIMLALRTREEKEPQTIGQLCYLCCDELEDIRFTEGNLVGLGLSEGIHSG